MSRRGALLVLVLLAGAARPAAAEAAHVSAYTLGCGVRLLVQPDPEADLAAVCVFVRAGVAEEGASPGVAAVVARAIFGDNRNRSSDGVDRMIYAAGGALDVRTEPDYTLITAVTSPQELPQASYVIAQGLMNADLDAASVQRARDDVLREVARASARPFDVAYAAMRSCMYLLHPYRQPFGGTRAGVSAITERTTRAFYEHWYTPDRTVIAVVGRVDPGAVRRSLDDQLFEYTRRSAARAAPVSDDPPFETARVARRLAGRTRYVLAGFAAPGLGDPDYPAFAVLTAIIGGGKSARLFRALRESLGVGYAVGAYTPALAQGSHLLAYVEYDPARPAAEGGALDDSEVESRLVETVRSVLSDPPSAREIERARRRVIGADALDHERVRDRAFHLGWYEVMGLGYAADAEMEGRLAGVTAGDVQRVARKYLGRWVLSVVSPGSLSGAAGVGGHGEDARAAGR